MESEVEEHAARTSGLLRAFAAGSGTRVVTIGAVAEALGSRSYGVVLVVLGLPAWIPVLPPGVPSIFGAAILVIAGQMAAGRAAPWLPGFVARRGLPAARFARLVARAEPWVRRVERVARPRLAWLLARTGQRLIALWIMVLALALSVPLPMTNSGPALAIAVIGLGLAERDGLVVLAGAALGLVSLAAMAAIWGGVLLGVAYLLAQ